MQLDPKMSLFIHILNYYMCYLEQILSDFLIFVLHKYILYISICIKQYLRILKKVHYVIGQIRVHLVGRLQAYPKS